MKDESPYTKREVDIILAESGRRFDSQDKVLDRIEKSVSDLLSRIEKVEKKTDKLEIWRTAIMWLIVTVSAFLAYMVPYSINIVKKDDQQTIQTGINQGFSAIEQKYNIQVDNNP